jgi:hypothetical protein
MKVYVVTSGCYSDYGIEAVFDSMELAQNFISLYKNVGDLNGIEEYDLSPYELQVKDGLIGFNIKMDKNGDTDWIDKFIPNNIFTVYYEIDSRGVFYFHLLAKDEKTAIKICNEKRVTSIAFGEYDAKMKQYEK